MVIPIGIQLYTVRQLCAQDFPGVLKEIAGIGYKGVEFAGLNGMTATEVKGICDDLGLQACAAHVGLPTEENLSELVETWSVFNITRLVTGRGPDQFKDRENTIKTAEEFAVAAELVASQGMELCYHNHWWEFTDLGGQTAYDLFFEKTSPKLMAEVDVYWVADGKQNPVEVLKRMAKRAPLLHIKDGNLQGGPPHVAVGSGKLDMPAIIGAADPTVTKWLIVELDDCQTDMLQAVRDSYAYLTGNDLAAGNR